MRDLSHWKDKVELSLDGRQLFFLFFGGAVMACLLFTLGVMTGRRLEARAIALEAPAADDPLAMLDQLGDLEDEELTYHQALTRDSRSPAKPKDSAATEVEAGTPAKPAAVKPAAPAPIVAPKPAAPMVKPVAAPKPAHAALASDADGEATMISASEPVEPAAKEVAVKEVAVKEVAVKEVAVKEPAAKEPATKGLATKEAAVAPASAVHFTLQLSAFAAKRDADDFMKRVQAAGYRPFVVSSDVPGKGIMYRVRVGDFSTKDVALSEKTSVEKKLKVVAYLARL